MPSHPSPESPSRSLDVAIVGAGAAGIGMALALAKLPDVRIGVLEAGRIGESFRRWPAQTRLITPSFHSTPFGLADLNAVNEASSPALYAGVEHLSGAQYADYLAFLAQAHALPVVENCRVEKVEPGVESGPEGGFILTTRHGQLHARFLIWASGEYQFPDLTPFPGAEHCPHYAQVATWADFRGQHYTVIGGFESGADAAVQLVRLGRKVRLLVRKTSWDPKGVYDPSLSLSPYTRGRLYDAVDTGRLDIVFGVDVMAVTQNQNTQKRWRIHAADGPVRCQHHGAAGRAAAVAEVADADAGHIGNRAAAGQFAAMGGIWHGVFAFEWVLGRDLYHGHSTGIGIGGSPSGLRPCHTTRHAGPHRAV